MAIGLYTKEALGNLFASKLRSFLALLGILVGTGSVVALVSIGQLATKAALDEIRALGTDLFSVSFYANRQENNDEKNEINQLKESTFEELQHTIPDIKLAAPYVTAYQSLAFEGHELDGSVIGANENLRSVLKITLDQGRFISHLDQQNYYAVIGHDLHKELKRRGTSNPIGKQIQLGRYIFTIIGVAEPWPETGFFHQDVNRSVIIPINVVKLISQHAQLSDAVLKVDESIDPEKLEQEIKDFINARFKGYQIYAFSAKEIIKSMSNQQQTFTILLGLIGGISLLVGGIGVMNIMLMSVVERRREIGIRRAIGARRRDIQMLFLTESITLTLLGGVGGVILGILASFIASRFTGWEFALFFLPPIIGFTVSVAIGIFFGYYPAYKASRLDPIETLRSE